MTEENPTTSHLDDTDGPNKKIDEETFIKSLHSLQGVDDIPDSLKWKTLYMMLVRITTIGMANSFQLLALVDTLSEKGIIDKRELEIETMKGGHEMTSQIMQLADELELEIYREARDIHIKDMQDKRKVPDDPTAGTR